MLEIKTVDMTQPFIISPAKTVRARLSARTLTPCVRPRACTRAHYRGLFTNLAKDFPYVRICHRPLEGVVRNLSQSHGTQGTWCRRRDLVCASVCPSLPPHFPQPHYPQSSLLIIEAISNLSPSLLHHVPWPRQALLRRRI